MGIGSHKGEFISYDGRDITLKTLDGLGGLAPGDVVTITTEARQRDEPLWRAITDLEIGDVFEYDLSYDYTIRGDYPIVAIRAEHQNTRALLERLIIAEAQITVLMAHAMATGMQVAPPGPEEPDAPEPKKWSWQT